MNSTLLVPTAPNVSLEDTAASRAARVNRAANLHALAALQPRVAALSDRLDASFVKEWVFARDGALTALLDAEQWWAGCSLPARAAAFMLRSAELSAPVTCFLAPTHAAQLRTVLDRTSRPHAVIALVPEVDALAVVLACADFTADIAGHRLWFAWGEQWQSELDRILEENPGLPTPTQFIRPILPDSEAADALVGPAQQVFAAQSARRAQIARTAREGWQPREAIRRLCVVAPSHFRLWDDAGAALAHALESTAGCDENAPTIVRFDPDDPRSASPAALATAAASCDGIVTPNTGRADLPSLVSDAMPWITWVTTPRIPAVAHAGPRDALRVADPIWQASAISQGWSVERVSVVGWTQASDVDPSTRHIELSEAPFLAIVADTMPLDAPERVTEYSSHRLLWESIRDELLADPLVVGADAQAFLANRMKGAGISADCAGFEHGLFIDSLIVPAYQQGLARLLTHQAIPLKLFGRGWDADERLAPLHAGPVKSRAALASIARSAAALVHVWPSRHAHPVEHAGRPVVRFARGLQSALADAALALRGELGLTASKTPAARCFYECR